MKMSDRLGDTERFYDDYRGAYTQLLTELQQVAPAEASDFQACPPEKFENLAFDVRFMANKLAYTDVEMREMGVGWA